MKKNEKLLIVSAIIAALVVGYITGVYVDYPKINTDELSGTIGKVSKYRNSKASEADITIKNDLVSDSLTAKAVRNYMSFYYVRCLELSDNIGYAIKDINANSDFKAKFSKEISSLEKFNEFLGTARTTFMMAIASCNDVAKKDPVLLRITISEANNTVAQLNYSNNSVLNVIDALGSYIQINEKNSDVSSLKRANDWLSYNQIASAIVLKDKLVMKFFEKRRLYGTEIPEADSLSLKDKFNEDAKALNKISPDVVKSLGLCDNEGQVALRIFDCEKLGAMYTDAEKLAMVFDAEKLGVIYIHQDKEELKSAGDMLNIIYTHDKETLNSVEQGVTEFSRDAERLGLFSQNNTSLGRIM